MAGKDSLDRYHDQIHADARETKRGKWIDPPKKALRCSFCGKSQDDVACLIAAPCAWICNECIELCCEVIAERAEVYLTCDGGGI